MSTGTEPLRIGIVGAGYIGTTVGGQFHRHPDANVVAVAEIDEEVRAAAGEQFGVPTSALFVDYERMYEEAPLDVVLVGTPHAFHHEQTVAAMERGLHVYCDKPLAIDLDDARDLAEQADASEVVLMVGYQRHLNPAVRRARERWAGDAAPEWITASITQNWYERFEGTWRADPDMSGGGILYDTGSHLLDVVLWTCGLDPVSVTAQMDFADDAQRVDTRANVQIRFATGAMANVSVHGRAPCVREHVHEWGDDGAVYLDGRQWEPRTVTEIDPESGSYVPYVDYSARPNRAEAFVEAVRSGGPPPATARDALAVTAVTEAAYEAARTGDVVAVSLD